MMNVFSHKDYRAIIKEQIRRHREVRGYQSRLAEAAGCQRSYLSQVLGSHVQLTPDHGAGMAAFWQFDARETDYFLTLVHRDRAGSAPLRRHLDKRLQQLRRHGTDLAKRFRKPQLDSRVDTMKYYSHWSYAAIHIAVSIPTLQTAAALSAHFLIPEKRVLTVLRDLQAMGLVAFARERWQLASVDIHLPKSSPMTAIHHRHWRQLAVESSQAGHDATDRADGSGDDPLSLHYTAIHSLSRKDLTALRDQLMAFIEQSRGTVAKSQEEELIAFCVDLFAVAGG